MKEEENEMKLDVIKDFLKFNNLTLNAFCS